MYGRNPAYAAKQSGTRMQQTREEIANLVKKAAATREKTAETDRPTQPLDGVCGERCSAEEAAINARPEGAFLQI